MLLNCLKVTETKYNSHLYQILSKSNINSEFYSYVFKCHNFLFFKL